MATHVLPPSFERFTATLGTYTVSALRGSTVTFEKYQPRPHSAGSLDSLLHDAPASSDLKKPPCPAGAAAGRPFAAGAGGGADGSGTRQSTTAYTRDGLLGETAMPVRPMPAGGKPVVSCVHVAPPLVDLKMPPPGPFVGA